MDGNMATRECYKKLKQLLEISSVPFATLQLLQIRQPAAVPPRHAKQLS